MKEKRSVNSEQWEAHQFAMYKAWRSWAHETQITVPTKVLSNNRVSWDQTEVITLDNVVDTKQVYEQVTIGFVFPSDWMTKWYEFC